MSELREYTAQEWDALPEAQRQALTMARMMDMSSAEVTRLPYSQDPPKAQDLQIEEAIVDEENQ